MSAQTVKAPRPTAQTPLAVINAPLFNSAETTAVFALTKQALHPTVMHPVRSQMTVLPSRSVRRVNVSARIHKPLFQSAKDSPANKTQTANRHKFA